MNDVYTRTFNIEQKISGQGVGSVQAAQQGGAGQDLSWLRTHLDGIKRDVENIRINQNQQVQLVKEQEFFRHF